MRTPLCERKNQREQQISESIKWICSLTWDLQLTRALSNREMLILTVKPQNCAQL